MRKILPVLLIFLSLGRLSAQQNSWPYLDMGFFPSLGIPTGGFREEMDRLGFGFGGNILVQIKPQPLLVGLDFSGQWYDRASVRYSQVIEGQERDFRLTSRSNLMLGHVVLRYQPVWSEVFWPYLDGMFGLKHFFTRTTLVELEDSFSQTFLEGDIDQKDYALSYGMALGLQLRPWGRSAIRLDLRCAYLLGPNASFMVRDPDVANSFDDPIEAFKEVNSPTHILVPQVGITIDLAQIFQTLMGEE